MRPADQTAQVARISRAIELAIALRLTEQAVTPAQAGVQGLSGANSRACPGLDPGSLDSG